MWFEDIQLKKGKIKFIIFYLFLVKQEIPNSNSIDKSEEEIYFVNIKLKKKKKGTSLNVWTTTL